MTGGGIQSGWHVSIGEEVGVVDLLKRRSPVGLERQQTADEVASRHGHVRRNCELVVDDSHVGFFQRGRLERRTTAQQRVPVIRHTVYIREALKKFPTKHTDVTTV